MIVFIPGRVAAQRGTPNSPAALVSAAFTYQGQLSDGGASANGTFNFVFYLYDDEVKTTLLGTYPSSGSLAIEVVEGIFTTELDFGSGAFNGEERWLEVEVNTVKLTPLQRISPAPYAVYAMQSPWSGLVGVPAGFADGTDDGLTSVSWLDINNRPAGLDDGDDDSFATLACANGEILEWDGAAWVCGTDDIGSGGGGGDITAVNAGTGLTGGGMAVGCAGGPGGGGCGRIILRLSFRLWAACLNWSRCCPV